MQDQVKLSELPKGADLLAEGRALARDWTVGPSAFLTHYGVASELDYKRQTMAEEVAPVTVTTPSRLKLRPSYHGLAGDPATYPPP